MKLYNTKIKLRKRLYSIEENMKIAIPFYSLEVLILMIGEYVYEDFSSYGVL